MGSLHRSGRLAIPVGAVAVLAAGLLAGQARAQSGAITGVHPVAAGQLAATFSSTSTECTIYGYCGWFSAAWQVAGAAACTSGGSHIVYVGEAQTTTGTQTDVDAFYPAFDPLKLCLYIYRDGAYQLVAEAVYASPPPPASPAPSPAPSPPTPAAPELLAPEPDALITAARAVSFRVRSPELDDWVWVEVSRSSALDADGTLSDDRVIDSDHTDGGETVRLTGGWTRRPGTYYWQASRIDCSGTLADCEIESEVRRLEIVPPPLELGFSAKAWQRLRRPAFLDQSNNLRIRLRCNRACSARLDGVASFRDGGRWRKLRWAGLEGDIRLRGGESSAYGFRFDAADRTRLIAVMREHGPLRWRLVVRATTVDGDVDRAVRIIRMTPPPLPPPPRPAPAPQSPSRSSCDPSYPGVCIPPAPPDLDCTEIPYSDFTVIGSDPHGFDGDGDGVGCES
jgi:hypothetical protein